VSGASTPPANTSFDTIVAGPDGALWFAGLKGQIGWITTSGTLSTFDLPAIPPPAGQSGTSTTVTPTGLTVGPDGALWFTGAANDVGRITTAGAVTEFATGSQISPGATIVAGPDGNLWFTISEVSADGASQIGRITPSGSVTAFSTPGSGPLPAGLTRGPDGNLWFTLKEDGSTPSEQPQVGKINPDGVVTLQVLPQGTTTGDRPGVPEYPGPITAGPDGALWFTEVGGIGRITTSGAIQQFAIPQVGNYGVTTITAGPDGAVWFAYSNDLESTVGIGRITTTGSVRLYPLRAGSSVQSLTGGPDGNLWFTDSYESRSKTDHFKHIDEIGRITPQGSITVFPLHLNPRSAGLSGINAGPDGALWFTGQNAPSVHNVTPFLGRITRRGRVTIFDLPADRDPHASYAPNPPGQPITGPDGKIWFTGTVHNTQGVIRVSIRGKLAGVSPLPDTLQAMAALPDGQVFVTTTADTVGILTRSADLAMVPQGSSPDEIVDAQGLTAGPDGNLWLTASDTSIIARITGLDTPSGGLDDSVRVQKAPDWDGSEWTNTTGTAQPTFSGIAAPGATVALSVQKLGDSQPIAIGQVQASPTDGSWKLTSAVTLASGSYAVSATQEGNRPASSVLYSLTPDSSGTLSNALVTDATPIACSKL
jgi:streptogramin lyase